MNFINIPREFECVKVEEIVWGRRWVGSWGQYLGFVWRSRLCYTKGDTALCDIG